MMLAFLEAPMPTKPRLRDRDGTARSLRDAALRLLAREGYAALGPNAIAAEAGCDKKLIYRYFGGVEGLLDAIGGDVALWLGGPAPAVAAEAPYGARLARLLDAYTTGLRADPVLQKLLAAELVAPDPGLRRLDAARSAAMGGWMRQMLAGSAPPEGVDAPAINAILLAALHYLTLTGGSMGSFAGMDCASPEGRARIDAALGFLLARAYAVPEQAP
jgi:AcrR family transcriptional regulator